MAEGIQEIAAITKQDTSNGHNIHYNFSLRRLVAVEAWPIFLEYDLDCSVLPTSWKLGITHRHDPTTGQIFTFITLTRTDVAEASIDVTVKIAILDAQRNFVRYLTPICSRQMEPNEFIEGSFEESRPPGPENYAHDLLLFLRITLLVRSCHVTEKFDCQEYFSASEKI